jgi:putative ABC transport system substrate-binding protein
MLGRASALAFCMLAFAIFWPVDGRSEETGRPVVGFLSGAPLERRPHLIAAFKAGLSEQGFQHGRNVSIELLSANGNISRLPALAAGLVRRKVDVIAATGGAAATASAVKKLTKIIPIVFTSGTDPVKLGLVDSLSHPGGNLTGVTFLINDLVAKRLQLLHEINPDTAEIYVLSNPQNPAASLEVTSARAAARAMSLKLVLLQASNDKDLENIFTELDRRRARLLFVTADPFFNSRRRKLVALAAHYKIPAAYFTKQAVAAGGLMSYGGSQVEAYRQAGVLAGRILKGEKPSNIPVIQSTRFELVINLKTARELGINFPDTILLSADEILE